MVRLSDLKVVFGAGTANENAALRGVDLDVAQGTFITVIGSNGAGKSTLLNVLAGSAPVASGRVEIDGRDVTAQQAHQRSALCARVFQDPLTGTCGPLTIEENMALADDRGRRRTLLPARPRRRRERFRALLSSLGLGLESRLGDRMELLSGGQRQAVSLLMATLQPSKILLLDEHTAALDPGMADLVMGLTRRIVEEQGLTALMVTHSMQQALAYGSRTIMMHRGQVVRDVSGAQREAMTVEDLIDSFSVARGRKFDQDSMLL
ncbi:MAG: ATP-binding cassette domain-containing protein [Comamonadaceae bacterium]|nr:MAG: ATP-binding cassette domain-containing protein [Comamonadaceae bacterium]